MNPPKRRRRRKLYGAAAAAVARKRGGGSRRASVRRSKHHSPAMRAKIGRAVRLAMRRRGGSSVVRRRSSRRSYSVARRSSSGGGLYVIKGRKLNPPRRRFHRRFNPSPIASIKGMLSKDTVMMAAGAIGGSVLTGFVVNRFGASLPLMNTKFGPVVYQLAIPLSAAYFLRRKQPSLAKGLAVGAIVMAVTTVMKSGMLGAGASTVVQGPLGSFYRVNGMGLAGEIGGRTRGLNTYITPATFNTIPKAVNSPVFNSGAWG